MGRRNVQILSGPDGREACRLVEVGGMVFTSAIAGIDPATGRLGDRAPEQMQSAFANLRSLMERAGVVTDEIGLVTLGVAGAADAEALDDPLRALFPEEANHPALKVNEYPLPGAERVQIQAVGTRGGARRAVTVPGFVHGPLGARVGEVVFSAPIDGRDPATGRLNDDSREQMRQALRNMESFVEAAGGTKADLVHVLIFIRGRMDQQAMLDAWLEAFPVDDDRPARKAVFDETLAREGTTVHLLCVAVIGGGRRRSLEVPGISKRHPNPMGCRIGNLVYSSGIGGDDPSGAETRNDAEVRAGLALANARALVEAAGGTLDNIGFIAITVNDYADEAAILRQWNRVFPEPAQAPARHVMAFGGRGSYPVQLHVVAALVQES